VAASLEAIVSAVNRLLARSENERD
jgi:hypothetical protein